MRLTYENGKVTLDDGSEVKSFLLEQPTSVEKALLSFISTVDESISGGAEEIEELKKSIPSWVSSNEKIPSEKLPSYVDDVLEFATKDEFPNPGETGKIYLDKSDNNIYRWSGSSYILVSDGVVIGETEGTAYDGLKGKTLEEKVNKVNIVTGPLPELKDVPEGTFYIDEKTILRSYGVEYPMWSVISKSDYGNGLYPNGEDPMGAAYGNLPIVLLSAETHTTGTLGNSSAYYVFKIDFNSFDWSNGTYNCKYYYLDTDSSGSLIVKTREVSGNKRYGWENGDPHRH